jgi:hypothetical protein
VRPAVKKGNSGQLDVRIGEKLIPGKKSAGLLRRLLGGGFRDEAEIVREVKAAIGK